MDLPEVSRVTARIVSPKTGRVFAGHVEFDDEDGSRLAWTNQGGLDVQDMQGEAPIRPDYVEAARLAVRKAVADGEFIMAGADETV